MEDEDRTLEVVTDGNGHDPTDEAAAEAFQGAKLKLDDLRRPESLFSTLDKGGQQGILQRAMTPPSKDEDYRAELKTGYFRSPEEADLAVAAINERLMCGVSIRPLVDKIIARSAGTNGSRLQAILEALTHTTFTTNYQGKQHWWSGRHNGNSTNKNSPIA